MKRQYSQINELIGSKLIEINMFSRSAQKLLLITGATESGYRYLKQYPTGPARSYFQIETRTSYDIWQNYLRFRRSRRKKIVKACHLPDLWMKEICTLRSVWQGLSIGECQSLYPQKMI